MFLLVFVVVDNNKNKNNTSTSTNNDNNAFSSWPSRQRASFTSSCHILFHLFISYTQFIYTYVKYVDFDVKHQQRTQFIHTNFTLDLLAWLWFCYSQLFNCYHKQYYLSALCTFEYYGRIALLFLSKNWFCHTEQSIALSVLSEQCSHTHTHAHKNALIDVLRWEWDIRHFRRIWRTV